MIPSNIAISVKNVSKTFKIPHEKVSSLRGAFTSFAKQLISSPPARGGVPSLRGEGVGAPVRRGEGSVSDLSSSSPARGEVASPRAEGVGGYELFKALDNVSFEVKKGEFFGIIGRNGSGKSTLLKILANIYQPDKGHVKINGMISPFLELGIGFNPELSGRDNVYLNATVLGMTKKQIDEKFDSIVAFSELERFIDQKLKNYSSGMQVRLAFSVSIHANRDILLMDEVLAVGDSNFQSKCLEEFNKYRDAGRTVILVTHDIATIQRYCDRALLLRNGKIVKIGSAEEVGNDYIKRNMTDEEGRMQKERDLSLCKENSLKLTKTAELIRVEFLDKSGKEKNVFKTGDFLSSKIYFKVHSKKKKNINFCFNIHNSQGLNVFGVNTIVDKFNTKSNVEKGFIKLDIPNLPLLAESYYVRISLIGENYSRSSLYAYIEKSHLFKVYSPQNMEGVVACDYVWN